VKKSNKRKKVISNSTLYIITSVIMLAIVVAGASQSQSDTSQAQTANITSPSPADITASVSPAFGCLGNCPMVITPAVAQVSPVLSVQPSAAAPVPGVSNAPGVSGAPQNPEQVPAGNPLQFLANPNGKVPPGRAKNFIEKLFAFLIELLGMGNNPQANPAPGGNQGPGAEGQQAAPANNPDANPAGGEPKKPGYGNNPGSVNPGGHVMAPGGKEAPEQGQAGQQGQEEGAAGAGAGQAGPAGASQPGTMTQPGAPVGATNPQPGQQNPLQGLIKLLQQLLTGKQA
jgi:hypothetical protein